MPYTPEPVLIKTFIPELPIETLHIGIINRFARTDKLKLNLYKAKC